MAEDNEPSRSEALHPRAIRIALERVLEHGQIQCRHNRILKAIYAAVLKPSPQATAQSEMLSEAWLEAFARQDDSERDQAVLDWYQRRAGRS